MAAERAFVDKWSPWEASCCAELARNGIVEFYKPATRPSPALPVNIVYGALRVQACRPLGANRRDVVALTREVNCGDREAPRVLRALGTTVKKWNTFGGVFAWLIRNGWQPDPVGVVDPVDYHYTQFCYEHDRLNFRGKP